MLEKQKQKENHMNPWNILGWILVMVIGLPFILQAVVLLSGVVLIVLHFIWECIYGGVNRLIKPVQSYVRYLSTRNVDPEDRQYWICSKNSFENTSIVLVDKTRDLIQFRTSYSHHVYSLTRVEWNSRVKRLHLYLRVQKVSFR